METVLKPTSDKREPRSISLGDDAGCSQTDDSNGIEEGGMWGDDDNGRIPWAVCRAVSTHYSNSVEARRDHHQPHQRQDIEPQLARIYCLLVTSLKLVPNGVRFVDEHRAIRTNYP